MKTAAIISYCSYHNAFIERCIEEAQKVADYVMVVSHTHFYDGKEDKDLLTIDSVEHRFLHWEPGYSARHYHSELRRIGYICFGDDYDAYFFIDADEILEGDRVKEWLKNEAEIGQDYKLAHFWYYRDTCHRANQVEEGAVLVSQETLEDPGIEWFGERERENYSKRWNYMTGYKNKVLGHHYSWAGTKEMLLRKISSWGHNKDGTDWEKIIEEEFTHEFQGCPFRPQYTFEKVKPYVGFTFEE